MRPEKRTYAPAEIQRMLAKHSEHAEKVSIYTTAALLVILSSIATTWSGLLWGVSGIIQFMLLPLVLIILGLAAIRRIFDLIIERLPGSGGAGR